MAPDIVQRNNPALRQHAVTVPVEDINTPDIQRIIADMHEALEAKAHGVALAAPQIGVSKRIFIVSHRAFEKNTSDTDADTAGETPTAPALVAINPEITRQSRAHDTVHEGCLSVPGVYGHIQRVRKATLRAYNENGEQYTRGASGLLAQIFQHEVDHLDGILFTDKAEEVWSHEDT